MGQLTRVISPRARPGRLWPLGWDRTVTYHVDSPNRWQVIENGTRPLQPNWMKSVRKWPAPGSCISSTAPDQWITTTYGEADDLPPIHGQSAYFVYDGQGPPQAHCQRYHTTHPRLALRLERWNDWDVNNNFIALNLFGTQGLTLMRASKYPLI